MLAKVVCREVVRTGGFGCGKWTHPLASQRGEITGGPEGGTEISRKGADVVPPPDGQADGDVGVGHIDEFQCVDPDAAWRGRPDFALAGEVVGASAADLERGEQRRDLLDVLPLLCGLCRAELGQDRADLIFGDGGPVDGGDFGLGVKGGGGGAEADGSEVGFGEAHEGLAAFGGFADEGEEHAGGEGVEGAGVAELGAAGEEAFESVEQPRGRDACGLVEDKNANGWLGGWHGADSGGTHEDGQG